MSVTNTPRKAGPYTGNNTDVQYTFGFKVFADSDLVVTRAVIATGTESTLVLTTDYSVTRNADQDDDPGGYITLTAALADTYTLTLTSAVPDTQPAVFTNLGGFFPAVLNNALDRLTILVQQLKETVSRSLKLAVSTPTGFDATLPAPVPYGVLGFNGTADGFAVTDPSGSGALAGDLANKSDPTKGAGIVKAGNDLAYDADSVGAYITVRPDVRRFPSLAAFFAQASGKRNYLPGGTYTLTSLLDLSAVPLSNAEFIGVPGQTVITGAFGYALLMLGALNKVKFYGIEFRCNYVNATLSSNTGVVMSGNTDWIDSGFERCKFTAPSANTQGLAVFNRTVAGGTDTCVIDGLYVVDSELVSIGGIGCTIYNRQESADKYTAAKRVRFLRNKCKDLGLSGTNGFAISLDGFGSDFELDHNDVSNPLYIGIENTGWIDGSISHNTFRDLSTRDSRVISLADPSAGYTVTGITAIGNKCIDAAKRPAYASLMNKSTLMGNEWAVTGPGLGTGEAFQFIDSSDNRVIGDQYVSDNKRAVKFTSSAGDCKRNTITNARFDTSASGANTAVVSFDGANVSDNKVSGRMFKGTGGVKVEQINSAASNVTSDESIATSGSYTPTLTNVTNVAASTAYVCQWTRVDNDVTVFGRCDVDPTAGGSTTLDISLPVASDLIATENLSGIATAISPTVSTSAGIFADTTNDRATMRWVTTETANHSLWFHFSYKILPG